MSRNVLWCCLFFYLSGCSQWNTIQWYFYLPQESSIEPTLVEIQQRINPLPQVQLNSIALSPNNQWLALAGSDGIVRIWNLSGEKREIKHLEKNVDKINTIAFSPNNQQIAFGGWDKTIHIWDRELTKEIHWLPTTDRKTKHRDIIVTLAYSPDGHYLASGSQDNRVVSR
ncbi:MAG: hypothetical protein HC877_19555 [Thioploca sp.]|nr:hypothetical protein [Thioploca sp.]